MNTRVLGADYEKKAAEFLCSLGMEPVEKNYRTRFGEIDLIMKDKETIVFVEVKFRKSASAGYALDAIDFRKRKQICRIAFQYVMLNDRHTQHKYRFDCIGIDGDRIKYVKNAFDMNGRVMK